MFGRDTTQTMDLPFGENCGSDTFTIFPKSLSSILRVCAASDPNIIEPRTMAEMKIPTTHLEMNGEFNDRASQSP
jgi:hypothetical protein